jgi:hypothetical protein
MTIETPAQAKAFGKNKVPKGTTGVQVETTRKYRRL